MNYSDTTIIIPTYNEEGNIGILIDKLREFKGIRIIVSDDGSRDKTQEIVKKKKAMLIDRSDKPVHGLTGSVMDAILKTNTNFFVVIDADFQHPPEKIKEMVKKLREGNDVVVGNRIKTERFSFSRRLISKTAYLIGYLRLIFKKFPKYDIVSGFFGGKTNMAKKIIQEKYNKFELRGYKILFDLLKYLPSSTKTSKVDYEFGMRKHGQSKLNKKVVYYYFRSLFK